jgi:phosphoglycerate dehydrogenase-like enzyme
MENVILIPHSIGLSDEFFTTMWEEITKQVRQMINGEKPETLVNPEVWDKSEFQNKLKNFHQELK